MFSGALKLSNVDDYLSPSANCIQQAAPLS